MRHCGAFLRLAFKADGAEKLFGNVHTADLVRVDAIPGDIHRMHMLKQLIPARLEVDEGKMIFFGELFGDRTYSSMRLRIGSSRFGSMK